MSHGSEPETGESRILPFTRGKGISKEGLRDFITGLTIPQHAKDLLLAMTPANYIGIAAELARKI